MDYQKDKKAEAVKISHQLNLKCLLEDTSIDKSELVLNEPCQIAEFKKEKNHCHQPLFSLECVIEARSHLLVLLVYLIGKPDVDRQHQNKDANKIICCLLYESR